jgi:hypothetical protein
LAPEGVGNMWEQSLTGGPARQITHFRGELIRDFGWSHDGKQLVLAPEAHRRAELKFPPEVSQQAN